MQSVIRTTERRISEKKDQRDAARVRSCHWYAAVVFGMLLLGLFITTNILLLRSYIAYSDREDRDRTGLIDGEDPVGPLLHEQLLQQEENVTKSGASVDDGAGSATERAISGDLTQGDSTTTKAGQAKGAESSVQVPSKGNLRGQRPEADRNVQPSVQAPSTGNLRGQRTQVVTSNEDKFEVKKSPAAKAHHSASPQASSTTVGVAAAATTAPVTAKAPVSAKPDGALHASTVQVSPPSESAAQAFSAIDSAANLTGHANLTFGGI